MFIIVRTYFCLILGLFVCLGGGYLHAKEEKNPSGGQGRIVGGTETTPGMWPWMAAIVSSASSNNFNGQFCAGTLVHSRYILTAAHCVDDVSPQEIKVILGLHRLDDTTFDEFDVIDIIIHPNWDPISFDSDIAILLLDRPVTGYAPLPIIADATLDDPGVVATAVGWGSTSSDQSNPSFPFELREVDLPIISNSVANQPQSYNGSVTANMLAAGFLAGGKDTCQGDSGGPLMVSDGSGSYVLAGIVSFGEGCAQPDFPGIYTRVSNFRDWVLQYLSPFYQAWEANEGVIGEFLDSDGDSLLNFTEYALGSDPNDPSSMGTPTPHFFDLSGQTYFSIDFMERTDSREITYSVERSLDLSPDSWVPLDLAIHSIPPTGSPSGGLTPTSIRSDLSTSQTTRAFMRVLANKSDQLLPNTGILPYEGSRRRRLLDSDDTDPERSGATHYMKEFKIENLPVGTPLTLLLRSRDYDPLLYLVNATTGLVIATDDNSGPGNTARIDFTPSSGVEYLVRVSSAVPLQTGFFQMAVIRSIISSSETISSTLTTAEVDPIFPGQTYFKSDYYLTESVPGRVVRITLTSSSFDTFLEIIDAQSGALIASDDDGGGGLNSQIDFTIEDDKDYIIRVTTALEFDTGPYTLNTVVLP